jgi:PAS domain S-box-containing protein
LASGYCCSQRFFFGNGRARLRCDVLGQLLVLEYGAQEDTPALFWRARGACVDIFLRTSVMQTTTPVNILLVDDEPANLLSLKAVLAPLRENLVCAGSGEEALKHLLQGDFAAVLLDIRMPTMNGFDVARMMRARDRSQRTPILFLTAGDDADFSPEDAYELGAVDFLRKPLSPVIVRAKISIFVELYRKTEDLTRIQRLQHAAALQAKDSRIRLILDNTKDYAFVGTDRDGIIREWAGGAEAITGWTPAAAIGEPLAILFTEQDRRAGRPQTERELAALDGRAEDKRWHRTKDGGEFYADGVMVALNDENALLQGFAKIFRNATAERVAADAFAESEERLRESEERVRLATHAGGLGVWTWCATAADAMSWENDLPNAIFGRAPGTPAPTRAGFAAAYLAPADAPEFDRAVARAIADGGTFAFQGRFVRPGEALTRWVELTGSYYPAKPARAAQVLGTIADITERKQSEERLRLLAADLSAVDQRKTEFLATLAHELRNPLAPIANGLAIMEHSLHDAVTVARTREIMQRQVNHMVHLVDDLLDMARISGGKIALRKQTTDLGQVIASAIETSKPVIDAGRHRLQLNNPDGPLVIEADPMRMAQVLSNLLNNAAKYTPPGGEIGIHVERAGDTVTVTVTDTGIGIPKESQHAIFTMFSQVERHLDHAQGGLGIGLALVHRLVDLHGGTVRVDSAGDGAGSAFSVTLPLPAAGGAPAAPARARGRTVDGVSLRALVVDDNDDAAQTLATLLELLGHRSGTAGDGVAALEQVEAFDPDIIFLDLGMPRMNGYECATALRAMPSRRDTVLVALTGWGNENDIARTKAAGFNRHLLKPVSIDALIAVLAEVGAVLAP